MSDQECRRVLNVPADANSETIRQAYLDLARVWHPDRFQADERLRLIAGEHLREINNAYAVLKNGRPPSPQSRPEPASAGSRSTSGQGSATATEERCQERPDPVWHPKRRSAWAPAPSLRYNRSLTFLSSNAVWAALVVVVLAIPYMAVSQLANLLRVPSLDNKLMSPLQPKILSPMRIIDPESGVSVAAETLANWARGDGIDLWQPVHRNNAGSPGTAAQAHEDGGKPPAPAHRISKRTAQASHHASPVNGTDLITVGRQSGSGEMRLSNHTGLEAVFQLVSERRVRRAVYVAPNGSVTLRSIPVGVYYLHVELGRELDVDRLQFLSDHVTPAPLGPFQFLQITSDAGTSGNHFDVVLNPQ